MSPCSLQVVRDREKRRGLRLDQSVQRICYKAQRWWWTGPCTSREVGTLQRPTLRPFFKISNTELQCWVVNLHNWLDFPTLQFIIAYLPKWSQAFGVQPLPPEHTNFSLRARPARSSMLSFVTNSLDTLMGPRPWSFFSISNGSQRAEWRSIVRSEQGKVSYLMFLVGRNGCNYLRDVQCLRLNDQWIFQWFFQFFRYFPLLLICQSFVFSFWNATLWKTWAYLFFLYEK